MSYAWLLLSVSSFATSVAPSGAVSRAQPTSRTSLSFRPEHPYQASLAQNFRDGLWLRASVSRWASRGSRATRSLKVSLVMGDSKGGSELMVEPTRSWPGRSMSVAVLTHADRKNGREKE